MKKWNLIIDVAKCTNCNNCVIATWDEHVGNDYPGYSAPQPRHGHHWIGIDRHVRGQTPMVDVTYVPKMCNHCDDAPCMQKAGSEVIHKRPDGIVLIDPVKAKGRKDIVDSCPYGAVWWNEELQLPQIWTFDAHLLDAGWRQPRCARVCPTDAIEVVKIDDGAMAVKRSDEALEVLHPEFEGHPRVYYRNLDLVRKVFVGGTVACDRDGVSDCLEGASIEFSQSGRVVLRATSDSYGDFKIDGIVPTKQACEIKVRHERYGTASISVIPSDSVYLGVISLPRS